MTTKAKRVLIRCDVNDANGYGHFTRCLYMARGIRESQPNIDIQFCGDYTKPALELLANSTFRLFLLQIIMRKTAGI
jgi:spore coat polysaccharide biosynthesis predicted glycosyltransferase SpsG